MFNPELTKNCWLQFSPHRLIVTPLVLCLVTILALTTNNNGFIGTGLDMMLFVSAYAFACVGGAYATANAIMNEFAEKTWDQQRMSPLSPWSLTWGKIFGGASYMWFGTALCIALFLIMPLLYQGMWGWPERIDLIFSLLGMAMLCQASALLLVLSSAGNAQRALRFRRNYVFGIVVLVIIASSAFGALVKDHFALFTLDWWANQYLVAQFVPLSLWCFAGWCLLGAYRVMRQQMQFRNGPLPWLFFNLFLMIYVAGFFLSNRAGAGLQALLMVAFFVGIVLTYTTLFFQPINFTDLQRLVSGLREKQIRTVYLNIPLWFTPLSLSLVLALFGGIQIGHGSPEIASLMPISILLFVLRDVFVFLILSLGRHAERAFVAAIVYLTLLYLVLPALARVIGLDILLGLFWPVSPQGSIAIVPVVGELVLLAFCLKRRYQSAFQR